MADIQAMEERARKSKKTPPVRNMSNLKYPKLKSISRVSKKAPRPSRFKNIGTRFFAALTGTTLFHNPSVIARNIGGFGSSKVINDINRTKNKTTLDKLSDLYAKSTDFEELKRGLTESFATLIKIMRFQSKTPMVDVTKEAKKPREEQIEQGNGKGNVKNIPVREVKYNVKAPSPYNTLTSEEIELRKSVRKSWRDSLTFISEAFAEKKPIVESWGDLRDYFQGMNCQGDGEGSDIQRNNGFTIRDGKVLIGKSYMRAEHDNSNDNYDKLWEIVSNDKKLNDWRDKVAEMEGCKFDEISKKKKGIILRAKFAIPQPFLAGGDVLEKEAHFFTANEIKGNFSVKNIEASIIRAKTERLNELKEKLKLTRYEGKESLIKENIRELQNIIRNPSYKRWMEENSRKDIVKKNEEAFAAKDIKERQKEFMDSMNRLELEANDFSVTEKSDGSYAIKVIVPHDLNEGASPYGQVEVELKNYSKLSQLPDGYYEIEKESGGLDTLQIKNGKKVDENTPMVDEPEETVALNNELDNEYPYSEHKGPEAAPSM